MREAGRRVLKIRMRRRTNILRAGLVAAAAAAAFLPARPAVAEG